MKEITHKNGNKVNIQYFGNLNEKLDIASGFIQMCNVIASQQNKPQLDIAKAYKTIKKQHDKFYGQTSKYDGKGNLRSQ